jgi:hypothetical protein
MQFRNQTVSTNRGVLAAPLHHAGEEGRRRVDRSGPRAVRIGGTSCRLAAARNGRATRSPGFDPLDPDPPQPPYYDRAESKASSKPRDARSSNGVSRHSNVASPVFLPPAKRMGIKDFLRIASNPEASTDRCQYVTDKPAPEHLGSLQVVRTYSPGIPALTFEPVNGRCHRRVDGLDNNRIVVVVP